MWHGVKIHENVQHRTASFQLISFAESDIIIHLQHKEKMKASLVSLGCLLPHLTGSAFKLPELPSTSTSHLAASLIYLPACYPSLSSQAPLLSNSNPLIPQILISLRQTLTCHLSFCLSTPLSPHSTENFLLGSHLSPTACPSRWPALSWPTDSLLMKFV